MAQTKKKRTTKAERELAALHKERQKNNLVSIILIVVALFIALSVYFCIEQLGWLAMVGKGLFGIGIYLVPVVLIYIAVSVILPEKRVPTGYKVASSIALLFVVGTTHYLFSDAIYTKSLDIATLWTGSTALQCGGLIEGLLAVPLIMIISRWGVGILLVAVTLFAVLSMTDRTMYDLWSAIRDKCRMPEPHYRTARSRDVIEIKPNIPEPEPEEEPLVVPSDEMSVPVTDVDTDSNPFVAADTDRPEKIHKPEYFESDGVDVPIDTYTVENDGLDENGQPSDQTNDISPVYRTTVPISGVEAFSYDDVDPANNIDPADLTAAMPNDDLIQKVAPIAPMDATEPEISEPPEVTENVTEDAAEQPEEDFGAVELADPPPAEQVPMYVFPPISLLQKPKYTVGTGKDEIDYNSRKLIETLHDFGVEAKMLGASIGPNVTRYELQPKAGTKVSKITGLADDIALSLAATQVRIEAPIPGKAAVGIEIPNQSASTVYIRDLLDSEDFSAAKSPLTVALGKDISGKNIYADLSKMPHLLIAGTTGSGKSVCVNTILMSLLYKASPEDLKLILIDPKVIELSVYNNIPHLFIPVVTDPKKAAGALNWACDEMDRRYNLFTEFGTRDIAAYNAVAEQSGNENHKPLPRIVVIIDELADLMMVASKQVEEYICRLCQKARAAGIFLIIATQSPRVDVVTGLIKANVPSRIAFAVSSGVDSRVILDTVGAEKLLGKGDMLYFPIGANKPRRIQGCFVADDEVENVVDFIRNNVGGADYDDSAISKIEEMSVAGKGGDTAAASGEEDEDEMLMPAIEFVVEAGMASTSFLQRKLKLGYSRAARLIDVMEEMGIIGPFEGSKPRSVKMTMSELQEMKLQRGSKE